MKSQKDFWEQGPPMAFMGENKSYRERRQFRYSLQDYMHDVFHFDGFRNKRVLEIGCGSGIDAAEFATNGALMVCVDFTETAVRLTAETFKEAGVSGLFRQADAADLPFDDNSFDCVYSFGVLHHIPAVEKVLEEIRRVLAPGGLFMGMVYNKDSLLYGYSIIYQHGHLEQLLDRYTESEITAMFSERKPENPYTQVYTRPQAHDLLSKYLSGVTIDVRYNVIDLPHQRKVKVAVSDEYGLGWHLIVKGYKEVMS